MITPEWWQKKATTARQNMVAAPATKKVLIEIAAQHPLRDGLTPEVEFQARLDKGIQLAEEYSQEGWIVEMYVPGSKHHDGDNHDRVSLSYSGTTYLKGRILPSVVVHGENLNNRYLPSKGVYGSADECYVTASYFFEGQFQELLAVVYPQQLARKMLHYLAFGVEPLLHTAPVRNPYHDMIVEMTKSVPEVLTLDPTAQQQNSPIGQRLRAERCPVTPEPPTTDMN